jgi:hypothetical protein
MSKKSLNFLVPMTYHRHQRITAGLLDERAENAYLRGQCFAFAYAYLKSMSKFEQETHTINFLFQKILETKEIHFVHSYIATPDGMMIDIKGLAHEIEYIESWQHRYGIHSYFYTESATLEEAKEFKTNHISDWLSKAPKQRIDAAEHFVEAVKAKVLFSLS